MEDHKDEDEDQYQDTDKDRGLTTARLCQYSPHCNGGLQPYRPGSSSLYLRRRRRYPAAGRWPLGKGQNHEP